MKGKYEKNFLDIASKLDAMSGACGNISMAANEVVNDFNDESIKVLVKLISDISASDMADKDVKQFAKALKDTLITYCGYVCVKNACNGSEKECEEERTLSQLLGDLEALVGLNNVKQQVNDLIAYQSVQKQRREKGLNSCKNTLHMAFTGNPGTGKTTVARIVGHIYKQIGLLSKGHFVEVSRTDLIAGYQGQTALKVKKVIEDAKGGVLFIDEAYSITENEHSDSYGRECLTELTKALEDYRDDLVVIVAGYTEPMNKFFESNPGLKSRFNTFVEFEDYSETELLIILESMCKQNDYKLSPELVEKLSEHFKNAIGQKGNNFANARMSRNLYDDLVMNHAKRVIKIENPNTEELELLTPSDFTIHSYL